MDSRQIIIREIEKWRRSNLLPEQYCDFLLNLYRDEQEIAATASVGPSRSSIRPVHLLWLLVGMLGLTFYAYVILYFTEFSLPLQLAIVAVSIALLYLAGFRLRNRRLSVSFLLFGVGSALLLIIGPYMLHLYQIDPMWNIAYLLSVSLIWIVLGLLSQVGLLQWCGWAGLALLYGWMMDRSVGPLGWAMGQLLWIPVSVLFAGLARMTRRWSRTCTRVFMLLALSVWFAPEIQFVAAGQMVEPRFAVMSACKLAVTVFGLYVSRDRWMRWVQ